MAGEHERRHRSASCVGAKGEWAADNYGDTQSMSRDNSWSRISHYQARRARLICIERKAIDYTGGVGLMMISLPWVILCLLYDRSPDPFPKLLYACPLAETSGKDSQSITSRFQLKVRLQLVLAYAKEFVLAKSRQPRQQRTGG